MADFPQQPGHGEPWRQSDPQTPPSSPGFPQHSPGEIVPAQSGGWESAAAVPAQPDPSSQVLTYIGDIALTQTEVIVPSGRFPIKGATWDVADMTRVEERVSTVGVILAIASVALFIWLCLIGLLGLLFLLMKEKKTTGTIQVTVHNGSAYYAAVIPARGPQTVHEVMRQVNYARSLSS
ncbi:hypothetical protein [Nocardiopsis coralliicola]